MAQHFKAYKRKLRKKGEKNACETGFPNEF